MTDQTSARVGRRELTAGLAWTLPALTVAAAAPAASASTNPATPPGLQGWIQWLRSCSSGQVTLTVDGNGPNNVVYPSSQYGMYVYNTTSTTTLTNACVTFGYTPSYNGQITWTRASGGGANWSIPVYNSATARWTTCYSGTWTRHAAAGGNPAYSITDQVPIFRGTATVSQCATSRTLAITRCVTVNGSQICFDRSVVV